jgi:hypothetical protein
MYRLGRNLVAAWMTKAYLEELQTNAGSSNMFLTNT